MGTAADKASDIVSDLRNRLIQAALKQRNTEFLSIEEREYIDKAVLPIVRTELEQRDRDKVHAQLLCAEVIEIVAVLQAKLKEAVEVMEEFPGYAQLDEVSHWWFLRGQNLLDSVRQLLQSGDEQ